MNELQKVEYNATLVLTTQQIAEAYGTEPRVISNNFGRNKDRYAEGKHYIRLEGDSLKAFKTNHHFDESSKVNKLYLWTQKGALLHAKSLNTDKAWEAYDRLVDSYFEKKGSRIDRSQLSPEIQALYGLLDNQAKLELEQRRQQEEISRIDTTVSTMKEIFTQPIGDWKAEINAKVREVAHKSGIEYQELYNRMYGELETTAHCSLKRLQENKKSRMEKAGNTKTAIKEGTTKIAIIFEKPQLKAIFETIVRQYAMRYCA